MRRKGMCPSLSSWLFWAGILCSFFSVPSAAWSQKSNSADSQKPGACRATLLMDAANGEVLNESNAHEPLPPASMVKMMVAYTVFKRLSEGGIKFDDVVTASGFASKIGGSQVYLKEHEQFTVEQLMEALLVQSANHAAVALAEHIAGNSAGFVEMMRVEAENLGMKETTLNSPHGLPPGEGQSADLISAYDLALLGRALITEFPQALELTGTAESTFRNGTFEMRNHNHLVRTFPGCDGIKTGYYREAGFGVTATAKKGPMRMIAVVMGCEKSKERDEEAARLLSSGFARYRSVKAADKEGAIGFSVPVRGGEVKEVSPVFAEGLTVTVKAGEEKKVEIRPSLCADLSAPVVKGTECGSVGFFAGGREVGRVRAIVPVDVKKIGLVGKGLRLLGW